MVNHQILMGHLGQDPEVKHYGASKFVTASVATSSKWFDKLTGEQKEQTTWHQLSFSGKLADVAEQYLKKGMRIYVEGETRKRKYTNEGGAKQTYTFVQVQDLKMLSFAKTQASGQKPTNEPVHQYDDDSIPF